MVMLSVIMPSVVLQSVILPSVLAPFILVCYEIPNTDFDQINPFRAQCYKTFYGRDLRTFVMS